MSKPKFDNELWKDIPEYEGRYQVSTHGRVRSLYSFGHAGKEAYLTPRWSRVSNKNRGRYNKVRLIWRDRNLDKQFCVHRLIAICFIPNPLNKKEVNHIDGNTENNHISNLEWATSRENHVHAHKHGLMKPPDIIDTGTYYHFKNKDGREFNGTPSMLTRAYPNDKLDIAYLHKLVSKDEKYKSYKTFKGWYV